MSDKNISNSFLFSSILQVSVAFPSYSNIHSSEMLLEVLNGIEKNRIEFLFFGEFISQSSVVSKQGAVTSESILTEMKGIASLWLDSHSELVDSIETYYKYCLGKTMNGDYYYMISRKEYIICTIQTLLFQNSNQKSKLCTMKASSDSHRISFSLSRPLEDIPNNTLLIKFSSIPEHFSIKSHNWLSLQQLLQELYLQHESSSPDLFSEALAQKLTRIFVQDGVLIPRYYNIYRKEPDSDIYWKYSPFYMNPPASILESLLQSICEHLQKEPSAFIFLKPVDSTKFPTYRQIISNPMDLQTIQRRILNHYYRDYSAFHRDMLQIFWNGCTFNPCNDIWYQQCVVLKLCYMHIYEELKLQGLVNNLPDDQFYDDYIISGCKNNNQSITCFTSASTPICHTIAQNYKKVTNFIDHYFSNYTDSFTFLSYPLRYVIEDYTASTDDEISLKKGEFVYVINQENESMVEVMKLDLVELGLFPLSHLENVLNDGNVLKRIREGKEIKEIRIVKKGKLVDVNKLADSTITQPIPIQTQFTSYEMCLYECLL